MRRSPANRRPNWQQRVEEVGLLYHTTPSGMPYWDESAFYELTAKEVDELERATNDLHGMCLEAVDHVIARARYSELGIPANAITLIERSWNDEPPAIYGRFDLSYDGRSAPKLLEYNADTPTALLEAAVVQWYWLQDVAKDRDQFNSIHERLIAGWKDLKPYLKGDVLHLAGLDTWEDTLTLAYMNDVASQAGVDTNQLTMEEIGWDNGRARFVDLDNRPLSSVFKLYPWEWLVREQFGEHLVPSYDSTTWIEPAWKMVLSNKGILPILWELHPGHPNLLESYFEPGTLKSYAKKPLLSREGSNITLVNEIAATTSDDAGYGEEGFIYQALAPLPDFDGRRPVVGSWVIQGQSAGIGIREADGPITGNTSRFVPHLF
ncbi:MAG: glutathionylspermidine synthase family protein [Gemmatimonadaceae bacterium]